MDVGYTESVGLAEAASWLWTRKVAGRLLRGSLLIGAHRPDDAQSAFGEAEADPRRGEQ